MKIKPVPLGITILVVLFGGILLTTALNWWTTTSTRTPAIFTSGEAAGQYNPADIRGSYTFGDIQKNFNVPVTDLAAAFEVPSGSDLAGFQVKNLETQYEALATEGIEIGTTSVRLFVAFYTGLPFDLSSNTYLPQPAVKILKEKAVLTPERSAYLETHTAPASGAVPIPEAQPIPANQESGESDRTVTGKTTFQDVLDWGVPKDNIQKVIGGEILDPSVTIKDYCAQKSLDVTVIKTALQKEVDQVK